MTPSLNQKENKQREYKNELSGNIAKKDKPHKAAKSLDQLKQEWEAAQEEYDDPVGEDILIAGDTTTINGEEHYVLHSENPKQSRRETSALSSDTQGKTELEEGLEGSGAAAIAEGSVENEKQILEDQYQHIENASVQIEGDRVFVSIPTQNNDPRQHDDVYVESGQLIAKNDGVKTIIGDETDYTYAMNGAFINAKTGEVHEQKQNGQSAMNDYMVDGESISTVEKAEADIVDESELNAKDVMDQIDDGMISGVDNIAISSGENIDNEKAESLMARALNKYNDAARAVKDIYDSPREFIDKNFGDLFERYDKEKREKIYARLARTIPTIASGGIGGIALLDTDEVEAAGDGVDIADLDDSVDGMDEEQQVEAVLESLNADKMIRQIQTGQMDSTTAMQKIAMATDGIENDQIGYEVGESFQNALESEGGEIPMEHKGNIFVHDGGTYYVEDNINDGYEPVGDTTEPIESERQLKAAVETIDNQAAQMGLQEDEYNVHLVDDGAENQRALMFINGEAVEQGMESDTQAETGEDTEVEKTSPVEIMQNADTNFQGAVEVYETHGRAQLEQVIDTVAGSEYSESEQKALVNGVIQEAKASETVNEQTNTGVRERTTSTQTVELDDDIDIDNSDKKTLERRAEAIFDGVGGSSIEINGEVVEYEDGEDLAEKLNNELSEEGKQLTGINRSSRIVSARSGAEIQHRQIAETTQQPEVDIIELDSGDYVTYTYVDQNSS